MTTSDRVALYDDIRRQALLLGDPVIAAQAWQQLHRLGAEVAPSDSSERWDETTIVDGAME
jgi:hypothetical protein